MLKLRTFSMFATGVVLCTPSVAIAGLNSNKLSDMMMAASIAYGYGITATSHDWRGALQLTGSVVGAQLATEGIKHVIPEKRPNGDDKMSFPSGHSTAAFSGAMFVHKRYGWRMAIPPYIMAGITSWARVDARAHYWHDVLGGAVVSALFTWMLVDTPDKTFCASASSDGARVDFNVKF